MLYYFGEWELGLYLVTHPHMWYNMQVEITTNTIVGMVIFFKHLLMSMGIMRPLRILLNL